MKHANLPTNRRGERGTGLIEFALSFSVLFLLFTGVYQFGYYFFVYNTLLTSVANAAEIGSKLDYDTGNTSSYTTSLTNMVVYGDMSGGTHPIVPGLSSSNVNVAMNPTTGTPQDLTITITGYTIDAGIMRLTINKPRVTVLYMGRLACASC